MSESLAIVLVILVMAVMYWRSGKGQLAALALPLICVPLARLLCVAILGSNANPLYNTIFIVTGLVAAVALCTLLCGKLPSRSVRIGYLTFSFVFSGALVVAYSMQF